MSKTQLYVEGDSTQVVTDAIDEQEFVDSFTKAFSDAVLVVDSKKGGEVWLAGWLGNAFDVLCKLRGYKTTVLEKRLIAAGGRWPRPDEKAVSISGGE